MQCTKYFTKITKYLFSFELRELESKLKAAYMNKERAAQLAEKEANKFDEMVIYPSSWNNLLKILIQL